MLVSSSVPALMNIIPGGLSTRVNTGDPQVPQNCRRTVAPLSPALLALHRRLKKAFDPRGILNPGRLYAEF